MLHNRGSEFRCRKSLLSLGRFWEDRETKTGFISKWESTRQANKEEGECLLLIPQGSPKLSLFLKHSLCLNYLLVRGQQYIMSKSLKNKQIKQNKKILDQKHIKK